MRQKILNKKRFHDDKENSSIYTEPYHNGKVTYLKMVSGNVYWHVKYNEPYVFLFFDNEIPKFADVEGRFYEHLNDLSSYCQPYFGQNSKKTAIQ